MRYGGNPGFRWFETAWARPSIAERMALCSNVRMPARAKREISAEQSELLRQIPSVDELLAQPRLAELSKRVDRNLVVEVARTVLEDLRARITGQVETAVLAEISPVACDRARLEERITALVERILARSLLP
ncbi:MAG TPA: hypothetical protein VNB49_12225, partial [Candidatus Dormibacteraeota bacterium]|nr:hypothetical protein [Candidatus Dormibacteraeota bacterium]